jgi:hypothetical protein
MVVVGERWCHIVLYPSPIVVYLHWTYQLTFFIVDKYITQWCRLSMVVVGGERGCLIVPCVGGGRGWICDVILCGVPMVVVGRRGVPCAGGYDMCPKTKRPWPNSEHYQMHVLFFLTSSNYIRMFNETMINLKKKMHVSKSIWTLLLAGLTHM